MAARESQIVLGLDPDPGTLWPATDEPAPGISAEGSPAERAASAVLTHCKALIDATAEACVAVKLQLACFERLGRAGMEGCLRRSLAHARARGLLVIADGKRGDIAVSAAAYAQALIGGIETPFGAVAGLGADMVTVNPLMGEDAIEPFVMAARARARACWRSCARRTRARPTSRTSARGRRSGVGAAGGDRRRAGPTRRG